MVPFTDIRSGYGATSTILTEYLEACEADVSQRLATALLYGIKPVMPKMRTATAPASPAPIHRTRRPRSRAPKR